MSVAATSAPATFKTGDTVRIGANDAMVMVGSTGLVWRISRETGHPIVDVAGRGRVSFTPDSLTLVDQGDPAGAETTARENGRSRPPAAVTEKRTPAHGISRELYLNATDTADELGISIAQLRTLANLAKAGSCHGRQCRYTANDIHGLRVFQSLLEDRVVSATFAAKLVDAAFAARLVDLIRTLHGNDARFLKQEQAPGEKRP